MVESASLTMLKNAAAQAKAVDAELTKDPPANATGPDEYTVDVDVMTGDQLDDLVKSQEIEVPEDWFVWDADAKRLWLKKQFGDAEEPSQYDQDPATVEYRSRLAEIAAESASGETVAQEAVVDTAEAAVAALITETAKGKKKGSKKGVKPATGTELSTDVAKTGEIVEPDVLQDMVHEIETVEGPRGQAAGRPHGGARSQPLPRGRAPVGDPGEQLVSALRDVARVHRN